MPYYDEEYNKEMEEIAKRDDGEGGYPERREDEAEAYFSLHGRQMKKENETINTSDISVDPDFAPELNMDLGFNHLRGINMGGRANKYVLANELYYDGVEEQFTCEVVSARKFGDFDLECELDDYYLRGNWVYSVRYRDGKEYEVDTDRLEIKITKEKANEIYKEVVRQLSEFEI